MLLNCCLKKGAISLSSLWCGQDTFWSVCHSVWGGGTPIRKITCALRLLKELPGFKVLIHQDGLHFSIHEAQQFNSYILFFWEINYWVASFHPCAPSKTQQLERCHQDPGGSWCPAPKPCSDSPLPQSRGLRPPPNWKTLPICASDQRLSPASPRLTVPWDYIINLMTPPYSKSTSSSQDMELAPPSACCLLPTVVC